MDDEELSAALGDTAHALRALGVDVALAPIADVLDAPNP